MKKKKWVKLRHCIVMFLARGVMWIWTVIGYNYRYKKIKNQKEPYLILYNHQTVWDQFFVGLICNNKTYFVMSDDLSSVRFVSPLLKWLIHPIPYKKSSTDFTILRNVRQVVNEGGSIAISPEGNRTYSGKTEYIKPSIVKMIKFLKIPVAIIHLEGGYGVHPRWADKKRFGKVRGSVYKIYQYDEYKDMTNEELYNNLKEDLMVDESSATGPYKSNQKAEYLERVIYNCPKCGFTKFISHDDNLICTTCNMKLRYNNYKQFEGLNIQTPFQNVNEWYEYQQQYLMDMELLKINPQKKIFEDTLKFFQVIPRKKKLLLDEFANLVMYANRIEIKSQNTTKTYLFDNISSTGVFGKNKLNFYIDNDIYQFKGDVHFNAMKYVNLYYKYRLEKGVETNDKFLGL